MDNPDDPDPFVILNFGFLPFLFYPNFLGLFSTLWLSSSDWIIVLSALVVITLLLFGSAMVSGSEVAYFSLSPKELNDIEENGGANGKRILKLLEKPHNLLATILIANNLFNIAIVITAYFATSHALSFKPDQWFLEILINTIAITFFLVLFGEVMPKVYATHNNKRLAFYTAFPLSILHKIFGPFSRLLARSTSFIENRLDMRSKQNISISDIGEALDIVAETNGLDANKDLEMLRGLVEFTDIQVKQIMCSRVDIFAIENTVPFKELCSIVIKDGYSRVPVYNENIDDIEGILYVKDLLEYIDADDNFKWQDLIKPTFFVPETKMIDDLLREIQQKRTHLAIVVDEYGGTSGLITLEDILEEIVGEIKDEYDDPKEIEYRKINRNNYIFDGKTMLHDMCKVMKLDSNLFDEIKGESESLGGLLLEIAEVIPDKEAVLSFQRFQFKVLSKDDKRIKDVKVTVRPDKAEVAV